MDKNVTKPNRKRKYSETIVKEPTPLIENKSETHKFQSKEHEIDEPTASTSTSISNTFKRKSELQDNSDYFKKSKNIDNNSLTKLSQEENVFLSHPKYAKTDLFYSDEKKCNYELLKKQDLLHYLTDEVSLEGLDGITLEALWKRFEASFPINLTNTIKEYLWRLLCNNKRIECYELEEPRDELISYDQYKYMDYDLDTFPEPPDDIKELYPYCNVANSKIKGSCSTFKSRKKLDNYQMYTLKDIDRLYGRKLVVVADQAMRSKAIIHEESDPINEYTDVEYCILERVGRARQHGELTQGKLSLQIFLGEKKPVYHNRKLLQNNFLIMFQYFHGKSYNNFNQNQARCLMQLTRFYNQRKSKYLIVVEKITEILRQESNYQMEISELRSRIADYNVIIKNMLKRPEFQNYFSSVLYNYRELYPKATKKEWLCKKGNKEKEVRVLKLVDPSVNVVANLNLKSTNNLTPVVPEPINYRENLQTFRGNIRDVYYNILSSGTQGVTLPEICENLQSDFYSTRQAVNKLSGRSLIDKYKVDLGRQQTAKYFVKTCNDNRITKTKKKCIQLPKQLILEVYKEQDVVEQEEKNLVKSCKQSKVRNINVLNKPELYELDLDYKNQLDSIQINGRNSFENKIAISDLILLKDSNIFEDIPRIQDISINLPSSLIDETNPIKLPKPLGGIKSNFCNPLSNKRFDDLVTKASLINALLTENNRISDDLEIISNKLNKKQIDSSQSNNTVESLVDNSKAISTLSKDENLKMEKFMGSNPDLIFYEFSEDTITVEIHSSTKSTNIVDNLMKYSNINKNMTRRSINRINFIIKLINNEKVVKIDFLLKMIRIEELQKGYSDQICKKSLKRLLIRLVNEGYLKIFRVLVKGNSLIRLQYFICNLNITANHPTIKTITEQFKLKLFTIVSATTTSTAATATKKIVKPIRIKFKNSAFNSNDIRNSILQMKHFNKVAMTNFYKYDKNIGKTLGYRPKFLRMRIIHEFLFYLVYDLCESKPLNNIQVNRFFDRFQINYDSSKKRNLPPMYLNEINWKMFIPSLPNHKGWPNGWFLVCDILLRLPLSIFFKLYNVSYIIPELDDYINDPIKQHFLIKYLPSNLRSVLLNRGKYFTSIYETIVNLCYIGLVQIGPKKFKDREQIFFYLNKNGSLLDTTTSAPAYNYIETKKYKKLMFTFNNLEEIERYWNKMWEICMKTPLGKRKVMDGKSVVIEHANNKPSLMKTLRVKNNLTAIECDTGKIPGDKRGAAGLDSSLWAYLRRNWTWKLKSKKNSNELYDIDGKIVASTSKQNLDEEIIIPKPIKYGDFIKQNNEKVYLNPSNKSDVKLSPKKLIKKNNKIVIRTIRAPKTCYVRQYHDSIDKQIMKNNRHKRVDWSEMEDRILCLSKATNTFLCPNSKKLNIPYTIVRDVLQRINPNSCNKTAKACQRRLMLLMSNDQLQIMDSNVENLLNSYVISKYFNKLFYQFKEEDFKLKDNEVYIAYIYLMSYLNKSLNEFESLLLGYVATIDYFSKPYINLFELILNNLPENSWNKNYKNPLNELEIKTDVIKSIVHSSLVSKINKPNWNSQLFNIYQQFSDELIRNAIAELKKNQLIASTKGHSKKESNNSWQTPLHLSFLYNLMLSSVTYSVSFFQNSYQKLSSIISNEFEFTQNNFICYNELNSFYSDGIQFKFNIPEIGTILNPNLDDHNEVIEELSVRFHLLLKKVYKRESERESKKAEIYCEDNNQLEDTNQKTNNTSQVEEDNNKEKEIVELKNDVMELIFHVPYFVEGDLEIYFKQMMDSLNEMEILKYIYLIIKELINITSTNSTDQKIDETNNLLLKELGEEFNVNLTKDKLTSSLTKVVYNIQKSMKKISNNCEEGVDDLDELEIIMDDDLEDNQNLNEPSTTTQLSSKDLDNVDQQLRQLPFIPGIVIDNRNVNNGLSYCLRRALTGDIPNLDEIKKGIMEKIDPDERRTIPHITDLNVLLTKELFPELDRDEETIERFKEHFVMQYPVLEEFVIDADLKEHYLIKYLSEKILFEEMQEKFINDCTIKSPKYDRIEEYISNSNNLEFVEAVVNFIKSKKVFGASANELKNQFNPTSTLIELLEFLMEINVILRTGVSSITFVHCEFQSAWLLENFNKDNEDDASESDLGRTFYIRIMPWIRIDGTLNEEELDRWLSTILSHCLDFPNIPFTTLCDKFCYIKPVDVYYLLEKLQELGCIEMLLNSKFVPSLFSKRMIVACNKSATFLDSFEDIYISTNNVSVLSISSYLNSKSSKVVE